MICAGGKGMLCHTKLNGPLV